MRYAIVADIHANLQAWNAVLLDIRSDGADRIICLGDIVGYGPNPVEVLESVHANVDHLVLGNHDAVVGGMLDDELFNEDAQAAIRWTREKMGAAAVEFLGGLPLTLNGEGFRCAHADFGDPAAFNYVVDPADALASWRATEESLLFVGHTHEPGIFLMGASGTPRWVGPQDFELEPGKRFLVTVGSVGQPRDGDARACYCIADMDVGAVYWRRVPFDLDAYGAALATTGLPERSGCFLKYDPRMDRQPLRERLDFRPPRDPEQKVRGATEVEEIDVLRRKAGRWRLGFVVLLLAGLLGAAGAGWGAWQYSRRERVIPEANPGSVAADVIGQNLLTEVREPVPAGLPVAGWRAVLGNRYSQRVSVDVDAAGAGVFRMESGSLRDGLVLASSPVRVKPGMRFCLEALCRKAPGFEGTVSVAVPLVKDVGGRSETVDQFLVKEPNLRRRDGWVLAKQTFTLPAQSSEIRVEVRSRFRGQVEVRDLVLRREL